MQSIKYHDGRKTLVRVVPEPNAEFDLGFYGTGVAVCAPGDHYDQTLGEAIAGARAMIDFGNQLEQAADSMVISEERFQELRALAKAERRAEWEERQALLQRLEGATLNVVGSDSGSILLGIEPKAETEAESPINIVVDEERYDQFKAEHDAAMADAEPEDGPQEGVALPFLISSALDDWKTNYFLIRDQLLGDGLNQAQAADQAADAATAIALG